MWANFRVYYTCMEKCTVHQALRLLYCWGYENANIHCYWFCMTEHALLQRFTHLNINTLSVFLQISSAYAQLICKGFSRSPSILRMIITINIFKESWVRIIIQVTLYRQLRIGRDGHLDQSKVLSMIYRNLYENMGPVVLWLWEICT